MTRLELHIESLLLSHDCVIVPGIGGFVTRYEGAFSSEDKKEIFPPYRSVSFNSQLRINDALLIQSYMTAFDTNYPKAQQLVEDDVKNLRDMLHKGEKCDIGTIGSLQLTQGGSIIFTPSCANGINAPMLYGLMPCKVFEPLALTTQTGVAKKVVPSTANKAKKITKQKAVSNKTQPKRKMQEQTDIKTHTPAIGKDDTHYVIRISKNAVRYSVAAVAAAMMYFVFSIAPNISVNENLQEASIIGGNKPAPVEVKQQEVETPEATIQQAETKDISQKEAEPVKTVEPQQTVTENEAKEEVTATPKHAHKITVDNTPESFYFGGIPSQKTNTTTTANPAVKPTEKPATKPEVEPATTAEANQTGKYTLVVCAGVPRKGAEMVIENLNSKGLTQGRIVDGKYIQVVYSSYNSSDEAQDALKELRATNKEFKKAWVAKQ